MPSPVPLHLEFRAKKIIGFLQPEHLTNKWAFCGLMQFYSTESLFLLQIKDPIGLLLYSYAFCSRPKWNVDPPLNCLQMTGSVFPYLPCVTSSAFNLSPSFLPLPPTVILYGHAAHGFHPLWEELFLQRKGCKLLKWSMKVANQILQCSEDENAVLGLASGSAMLGF